MMNLEENIENAPEYKTLYEDYPHLAESIRLRKEKERLMQSLKSLKSRSASFQRKGKMKAIEARLSKENLLKRLYGENKQGTRFKIRFTFETSKKLLRRIIHITFKKAYVGLRMFDRTLFKILRRKLPPIVFDLKSLHVTEKGLEIKEWVKKRYEER